VPDVAAGVRVTTGGRTDWERFPWNVNQEYSNTLACHLVRDLRRGSVHCFSRIALRYFRRDNNLQIPDWWV